MEQQTGDSSQVVVPSTIRTIVGSKAQIFQLGDFLKEFAPSLEVHLHENPARGKRHNALMRRLAQTLVSPVGDSLKPIQNCAALSSSQESLSTLVDDVIWSMVINASKKKAEPNVLSKGYVVASEQLEHQVTRCAHMRAGVMCKRLNGNVSFCKTSRYLQTLHAMVGDDMIRILLLRTRMFVPLDDVQKGSLQNYLLLCGPIPKSTKGLLPAGKPDVHYSPPPQATKYVGKNSKSRKRSRPWQSTNNSEEEGVKTKKQYDALAPNTSIIRRSMFYSDSYVPKVGMPQTHILNQTQKGLALLEHMIPLRDNTSGRKRRKRWNRLRESGPALCMEILLRHSKKCDYHRLLERDCPLPSYCVKTKRKHDAEDNPSQDGLQEVNLPQLSAAHTDANNVVAFLNSVLRTVFPESFWGSSRNFSRVLEVVEVFVKLRRREELPNKAILKGIRVTDFHWLLGGGSIGKLSRAGHEALTRLVTMVLRWVFSHFVIPLLRSNFYVTESEFSGKRVLFYRKPVWALFRSLSMKHLLTKQYKEIDMEETKNRLQNQQMGCSRLRLLPKATGVRPIATLCKRESNIFDNQPQSSASHNTVSKRRRLHHGGTRFSTSTSDTPTAGSWSDSFKSTNDKLRDAFAALKFEHQRNPKLFGAGLLGLHSFYPRYHGFVARLKRSKEPTKLYFASVDVRHCYDNIDQDRLLDIVMDVLSEEDYMIHRYSLLHASQSMNQVAKKNKMEVGPPETFNALHKLTSDVSSKWKGAVFLGEANSSLANREKVLALIREHLKSHLVVTRGRYGNRCLLQEQGIPQGSVLSAFLCNFYYGAIQKELLGSDLNDECSAPDDAANPDGHVHLLARIIDDFLLITTDQAKHKAFLQGMYKGKPSLGVHINKDKVFSNFQVSLTDDTGSTQTIHDATLDKDGLFPWCGMLLDTQSLEVQIDYSRFEDDKAGNNINVARSNKEGDHLRKAMKSFVRPRCLPILFDLSINNQATRDANFFDLVLLCAIKTEEYVQSGGMLVTPQANVAFLLSCIEDVIQFSVLVVKDRLEQEYASMKGDGIVELDLSQDLALSLGWNAFFIAFRKPQYLENLAPHIKDKLRKYAQCSRVSRALRTSPQLLLKKTNNCT